MRSSFVIYFHTARMDNLLQCLRFLERDHLDVIKYSELVIVCQNSCEPLNNAFGKYQHINLEKEQMMLPYATNLGIDASVSEKLIILESDRLLPAGYFDKVFTQLHEGVVITTRNMVKLKHEATDEDIMSGNFDHQPDGRREDNQIGIKNMWSGNTALMKSDFYKVGKMDERYLGYGWADTDMTETMIHAGIEQVFREEMELHLWHTGAGYGSVDETNSSLKNGIYYCKKWKKPIPPYLTERIQKNTRFMI